MNQNDTHSPKFCGIRNLTLIQTQYLGSSPLHHNISTTTLNLYESLVSSLVSSEVLSSPLRDFTNEVVRAIGISKRDVMPR